MWHRTFLPFFLAAPYARRFTNNSMKPLSSVPRFVSENFPIQYILRLMYFSNFHHFFSFSFFLLSVRYGSFANFKRCSKTLNDSNDNTKRNKTKQRLCDMHKYNLLKCYFYRCQKSFKYTDLQIDKKNECQISNRIIRGMLVAYCIERTENDKSMILPR